MTTALPTSVTRARARGLAALVACLVVALAPTPALADPTATSMSGPTASSSSVVGSTATGTGSPTSGTTVAGVGGTVAPTSGAGPSAAASGGASASSPTITSQAADTTGATPSGADDVRPASPVLAAGAADATLSRPTRVATTPSSALVGAAVTRPVLDAPIVAATSHHAAAKATLTQLASGGPFVAASLAPALPASHHFARRVGSPFDVGLGFSRAALRRDAPPIVAVSVPLVGVYVGSQAAERHIDARPMPPGATPVGPSGLGATTVSPFGPASPGPGGATALFGNAPFSSTGGGAPLLGLDTMLVALVLLVGISWRRRSWDLPALRGESALLASALDRPG